jgi:hypothetical protein
MDEQRERWMAEFRVRLQAMRGFFAGLNPELSEQQALRELLEENEFMVAPLRVRLAEIEAAKEASHGSGQ